MRGFAKKHLTARFTLSDLLGEALQCGGNRLKGLLRFTKDLRKPLTVHHDHEDHGFPFHSDDCGQATPDPHPVTIFGGRDV